MWPPIVLTFRDLLDRAPRRRCLALELGEEKLVHLHGSAPPGRRPSPSASARQQAQPAWCQPCGYATCPPVTASIDQIGALRRPGRQPGRRLQLPSRVRSSHRALSAKTWACGAMPTRPSVELRAAAITPATPARPDLNPWPAAGLPAAVAEPVRRAADPQRKV